MLNNMLKHVPAFCSSNMALLHNMNKVMEILFVLVLPALSALPLLLLPLLFTAAAVPESVLNMLYKKLLPLLCNFYKLGMLRSCMLRSWSCMACVCVCSLRVRMSMSRCRCGYARPHAPVLAPEPAMCRPWPCGGHGIKAIDCDECQCYFTIANTTGCPRR